VRILIGQGVELVTGTIVVPSDVSNCLALVGSVTMTHVLDMALLFVLH